MTELFDEIVLIGEEAWRRWPDDVAARRDHIKKLMDQDVTWAVLERCYPQALALGVSWLLNEAKRKMDQDAGRPAGGGDQTRLGDLRRPVRAAYYQAPETGPGSEPTNGSVASNELASAAPTQRDRDRVAAIVRVEARLSRLDTVYIGTKRIGDCTVAEVKVWARQRGADAAYALRDKRFALSLVSNLPGGEIVRNWVSDKEADEQYERAEREYVEEP